jgi:hypothetical protein
MTSLILKQQILKPTTTPSTGPLSSIKRQPVKLNPVQRLIARTRPRTQPDKAEFNDHNDLACFQDPFEKAMFENEKIMKKIREDEQRLARFRRSVKERLRVYKHVEHRIDEDGQLKIDKSSKVAATGRSTDSGQQQQLKLRSMSAECLRIDSKLKPGSTRSTANIVAPPRTAPIAAAIDKKSTYQICFQS